MYPVCLGVGNPSGGGLGLVEIHPLLQVSHLVPDGGCATVSQNFFAMVLEPMGSPVLMYCRNSQDLFKMSFRSNDLEANPCFLIY
jgi:hypothetical protein